MKKLLLPLLIMLIVLVSSFTIVSKETKTAGKLTIFNSIKPVAGSDTVTKTFAVSGNGACKSTIESTLTSQSGVISASWDSTAKQITVTYDWKVIKKSQMCRLLANAGYDNAQVSTKASTYANLPAACQYTRVPISQ